MISPNTLKKAVCEQNSVPLQEKKKARKRKTNKGAGQPAPSTTGIVPAGAASASSKTQAIRTASRA